MNCKGIGKCQDQGCPAHYAAEDFMRDLIENLREGGKFLGGNFGNLMREAADALEAKAAPVGERAHDTKGSRKALGAMNAKLKAKIGRLERELAAYQRQSGVVMPPNPYKPELSDADLTDYEKGELQGRCDMWAEFARLNGGSHV